MIHYKELLEDLEKIKKEKSETLKKKILNSRSYMDGTVSSIEKSLLANLAKDLEKNDWNEETIKKYQKDIEVMYDFQTNSYDFTENYYHDSILNQAKRKKEQRKDMEQKPKKEQLIEEEPVEEEMKKVSFWEKISNKRKKKEEKEKKRSRKADKLSLKDKFLHRVSDFFHPHYSDENFLDYCSYQEYKLYKKYQNKENFSGQEMADLVVQVQDIYTDMNEVMEENTEKEYQNIHVYSRDIADDNLNLFYQFVPLNSEEYDNYRFYQNYLEDTSNEEELSEKQKSYLKVKENISEFIETFEKLPKEKLSGMKKQFRKIQYGFKVRVTSVILAAALLLGGGTSYYLQHQTESNNNENQQEQNVTNNTENTFVAQVEKAVEDKSEIVIAIEPEESKEEKVNERFEEVRAKLETLQSKLAVSNKDYQEKEIGDIVALKEHAKIAQDIYSLQDETMKDAYYDNDTYHIIESIVMQNNENIVNVKNMEEYDAFLQEGYQVIGYTLINEHSSNEFDIEGRVLADDVVLVREK